MDFNGTYIAGLVVSGVATIVFFEGRPKGPQFVVAQNAVFLTLLSTDFRDTGEGGNDRFVFEVGPIVHGADGRLGLIGIAHGGCGETPKKDDQLFAGDR
ncbi:hypothetical protein QRQ56_26555 [Bradyrhizobium sp. U531]|uniref:hypothetical protein n=1 Tax=Bradyrhizobium sp. U531 TaxID=3053458 RepID=UPI003F433B92